MPAYQSLTQDVLARMTDGGLYLLLWWNPAMTCWTVSVLQVSTTDQTIGGEPLEVGPGGALCLHRNPVFWLHEAQATVLGAEDASVSELAERVSTAIVGMTTRVRLTRAHMIKLPATETHYVMIGRSGPEQCAVGSTGKINGRKAHWVIVNNEKCEVVYGADDAAFVVHDGQLADVHIMA